MQAQPERPVRPARGQGLVMALLSLVALVVFVVLIAIVVAILGWIVLAAVSTLPEPDRKWPRLSAWAIVLIPVAALVLAFFVSRRAEGRTFYAQQSANRWISVLLLVAIVGLLVTVGEAIAAALTFDSYWAMFGAGLASVAGIGAGVYAHFNGADAVLDSMRARKADARTDAVLTDVVNELSIAANMAPPRLYVVDDPSINAMAVGTNSTNAAVAVTSGAVAGLDREQLQGVIGHELSHIRNLDSRYGVYVAILVGLVALVTDGFLRIVLEGWKNGVFLRGAEIDDEKGAVAGFVLGAGAGLLLLVLAGFLRLFAPLASLFVQAAVSRQREYLADATSVELTRNPTGLARALAAIRADPRPLARPNRGSQHLWFSNPLGHAADAGWRLLATHPSVDARIDRLGALYPKALAGASAADIAEAAEP